MLFESIRKGVLDRPAILPRCRRRMDIAQETFSSFLDHRGFRAIRASIPGSIGWSSTVASTEAQNAAHDALIDEFLEALQSPARAPR